MSRLRPVHLQQRMLKTCSSTTTSTTTAVIAVRAVYSSKTFLLSHDLFSMNCTRAAGGF